MKKIYLYRNYNTDTWIVKEEKIPQGKLDQGIELYSEDPVSQRALTELERSPLIKKEGQGRYKGDWVKAILSGITTLDYVAPSNNPVTDIELDFPWGQSMYCGFDGLFKPGKIYSEFDILAATTLWYQSNGINPYFWDYDDILKHYQLSKVTWNGLICYQIIDVIK